MSQELTITGGVKSAGAFERLAKHYGVLTARGSAAIGLAALLALAGRSYAQTTIVSNPITGTNPNGSNPYTAGQTVASNLTFSGIGRGGGLTGNDANNRYNASSFSTASTLTLANDDYFTFTLTPGSGFKLNLNSFVYTGQVSTGTPSLSFRSSVDSFGSSIGTASVSGATIDLSGSSYQDITAPIEFRLYGYNFAASTTTFSVNDFSFTGTIATLSGTPINYYFDTNGTTAGAGTPSGTYSSSGDYFNSAASGTPTPGTFTQGQKATFAAGADSANSTYSVSIDNTFSTAGLSFEEGNVSVVNGGGTLVLEAADINVAALSASISAPITGATGLTKSGAGTLNLSGNNTYTGLTTIGAGTLAINDNAALGNATNGLTFSAGGTLKTATDLTLANTRAINGPGTFDVADGTTLTVNGTYGSTTSGLLTLANSGTLELAGSSKAAAGVTLSAPGTLKITGSTLTLGGNVVASHATGTSTISGALATNGTRRDITVNNAAATLSIMAAISGGGGIDKFGPGTLVLGGTNTYTGITYLDDGVLAISSDANLGGTSSSVPLDFYTEDGTQGTLRVANSVSMNANHPIRGAGKFDIPSGAELVVNGTYGTSASRAGLLTLVNTGTLRLANTGTTANAAVGISMTAAGTLDVTGGALAIGGTVTASHTSGTATVSGKITTEGDIRDFTVSNAAAVLAVPANVSGLTGGGITKKGPGTLILSGTNTYPGITTLDAGTLTLSGSSSTSTVSVNSGRLNIGAAAAIGAGELSVGIAEFDNTSGGPISITNNLNFASTGTTTFVGSNSLNQSTGGVSFGSRNHTLAVNGSTLTLGGTISGAGTGSAVPVLTKTGNGKLVLSGSNTYGTTTTPRGTSIIGGTLVAASLSGSATGNGPVSVGDGTNPDTGVLAGTGTAGPTVASGLSVAILKGGTVTGGTGATTSDTVGKLTIRNTLALNGGGTYAFKIGSTAGSTDANARTANAGTNWDKIQMTTLNLTGVTSGNPFTIKVLTLSALTFEQNAMFGIANITGTTVQPGITNLFVIDTDGLGIPSNQFSVVTGAAGTGDGGGYDLFLSYNGAGAQSAPEPGTAGLIGLGASAVLGRRRRRLA